MAVSTNCGDLILGVLVIRVQVLGVYIGGLIFGNSHVDLDEEALSTSDDVKASMYDNEGSRLTA